MHMAEFYSILKLKAMYRFDTYQVPNLLYSLLLNFLKKGIDFMKYFTKFSTVYVPDNVDILTHICYTDSSTSTSMLNFVSKSFLLSRSLNCNK